MVVKNPPASARDQGLIPWVGEMPWRRAWQPTPVFLPGETPRTEEPGGLQSMGLQSWTWLSDWAQHVLIWRNVYLDLPHSFWLDWFFVFFFLDIELYEFFLMEIFVILIVVVMVLWWYTYVAAAAAAKSLQSCPTLCDPIDGSPPGSPVPGILQARTLEWVALAFSDTC